MNMQFKKQQCYVAGLALGWIGYAGGLAYFSYQRQWVVVLLWMAGYPSEEIPMLARYAKL